MNIYITFFLWRRLQVFPWQFNAVTSGVVSSCILMASYEKSTPRAIMAPWVNFCSTNAYSVFKVNFT